MKLKTLFISFIWFFLLLNLSHSEMYMTKGPAPGEIYFQATKPNTFGELVLCHSWDYGETFTVVDSTSQVRAITADADSGGIYSLLVGGGLYYSNNYGNSWSYKSFIDTDISSGLIPGIIYAVEYKILRSINYGLNFTQGDTLPGGYITIGSERGEIYSFTSWYGGKLYFSADSGNNFIFRGTINSPTIYEYSISHGAISGELFLLNITTQELFFSNDSGKTFNLQYQFNFQPGSEWAFDMVGSFEPGEVIVLAFRNFPMPLESEFYIYHSSNYGQTWNYNHHITDIKNRNHHLLELYYLSQNYPNPFNGETTIEFYLPTKTNTDITLYNITGEKIKTLLNEQLLPGKHSVRWDGTNEQGQLVSSGLYFYQLKTITFSQSKKLLYIR